MLRLAGTNALAIVTFALIYAAGGSRWLTQGGFLASLAVFFVSLTALWVYVERTRPGARDVLSRIGRGVLALVAVVIGLPALVLAPLFALQEILPPDAGFADVVRPVMVLLLLALVLVIAMNVAGTVVLVVSGLRSWLSRDRGAAS
ncbi:MAG TPA: hypothetical protein VKJ67_08510 [Methylomirabilota bacterium]|nr:hypothetical protein [Methylomirabilota bacterium]